MRTAGVLVACLVAACSADDVAAPSFTVGTALPTERVTAATSSPSSSPTTTPLPAPVPTTTAPLAAPGYPAQRAGVPFPAAEWSIAPLPAGVDHVTLDTVVDAAMGPPDSQSGVRSVVVVHGGSIVYERYHASVGPQTVFSSFSLGKSFTSAILGLLVGDGLLSLDDSPPRPEWPAGDRRAAITLRELLQMTSGLDWTEEFGSDSLALRMLAAPSAASLMASQPLEREPGSAFEYSTGTSALLAGVAADALGGCAGLDEYLQARLLDPIGITTEQITRDAGGCFVGGVGMDMTTRDFARFGLLYLRGGVWNGEQVIPTSWIDETRVPSATQPSYGLHWWLGAESFSAEGLFGQRIVVVPAADLVTAINTAPGGDPFSLTDSILVAFGAVS